MEYGDQRPITPTGFQVVSATESSVTVKWDDGEKEEEYWLLECTNNERITTLEANVNLSGLPAIAAQAEAGSLRGSLVVQTLGVSGKNIATALPLPSELNTTTLTNSILSMGAIKAMIYDDATYKKARIVGFYNPFGGGEAFVNALIDALSESRHEWYRACE